MKKKRKELINKNIKPVITTIFHLIKRAEKRTRKLYLERYKFKKTYS